MKILCLLLLMFIPVAVHAGTKQSGPSPHAEALTLVFQTQEEKIAEIDHASGGDWWQDVKERAWIVQRPFYPGWRDSTHLFEVTYKIEGREVASWLVDTRAKTVQGRELPNQRPEGTPAKAPPSNPSHGAVVPHP